MNVGKGVASLVGQSAGDSSLVQRPRMTDVGVEIVRPRWVSMSPPHSVTNPSGFSAPGSGPSIRRGRVDPRCPPFLDSILGCGSIGARVVGRVGGEMIEPRSQHRNVRCGGQVESPCSTRTSCGSFS